VVALVVVVSVGTAGYAVMSGTGGSSDPAAESAGAPTSSDGEPDESRADEWLEGSRDSRRTSPTEVQQPTADAGTQSVDSSEPDPGAVGQRATSRATPSGAPEDTTPPKTSLSEEFPARDAATFSFSANERATFACSLDGAAYVPCDSPTSYSDLDPGWHTFAVRATDAAGNVDPSPAETRWHARDGRSADQ
jgi:hypothetical protein